MDKSLGIRKQGLIVCFRAYHDLNKRYPESAEELSTVTATLLIEKNFQKYRKWFFDYMQGAK